jgi:hypothetical protein
MNDETIPHIKGIIGQLLIRSYQTECIVAARTHAERFFLLVAPVETEIAYMNDIGNVLGIYGSIGARMRTGFTADAAHVVPYQQFVLVCLLLQRLNRTCCHTVGVLTPPADQIIGSQFCNGHNAIVGRVIKITALNLALLALTRTADIEIHKEPHIRTFFRLHVDLSLMKLLSTC